MANQPIEMAQVHGWLVHHQRPAMTARGWRSAIQGTPGFPDLVLCGGPGSSNLLIWELKTEAGSVTNEQDCWLHYLQDAGIEARIIRPSDLDWARERLAR